MVTQLALCYPEVGFTLTSAGRKLLQCPPVARLEERLYQIYGDRPDLIEVGAKAAALDACTASSPRWPRPGPTRGPQNVFVNRRVVKDRTIAHAILDAYSVASNRERSPEVHLFIEMPPDSVDVNVHPTKAEVRFREQSLVHEVVRRAVARCARPRRTCRSCSCGRRTSPPGTAVDAAIPGVLGGGVYTSGACVHSVRARPWLTRALGALAQRQHPSHLAHRLAPGVSPADAPADSARAVPGHVHHRHR